MFGSSRRIVWVLLAAWVVGTLVAITEEDALMGWMQAFNAGVLLTIAVTEYQRAKQKGRYRDLE